MIGAARALPFERRVPAFAAMNARVISPLAGYGRRALANLQMIYPERRAEWHRETAQAAVYNAGRVMIENYSNPTFMERAARFEVRGNGFAAIRAAQAEGRPVVLATGHFGNYEAGRAALLARGLPAGGLYRPMSNPYFNAHYRQTMEIMGPPVFPQGRRGTMGLLRHLQGGGMAVLLTDVHVPGAPFFNFLGKPARTALSAAELAIKRDALLVPFYATRLNGGLEYRVELEPPVDPASAEAMTRSLVDSLEARITAHPGQWFWVHRRWKGAPEGAVL
ncbi:lysophospholipid acyltransferase family protein [Alphaproteobacteria bacterium KMM 3653]|uniref:Lysophospholipid acyltransferase family protein n=2 Tax=Harenicola maris TaxID=2841044 RepID=A0AAP2G3F4_9RHOB|nr:lysophospholipid acyltransferase family protein [Harenicola maris]